MPSGGSNEIQDALLAAEFYLRIDLAHLESDRRRRGRGWDPERWDATGEGEEICREVLAKVRGALAEPTYWYQQPPTGCGRQDVKSDVEEER